MIVSINADGMVDFSNTEPFEFNLADLRVDDTRLAEEAAVCPELVAKLGAYLAFATRQHRLARLTRDVTRAAIAERMRSENPKVSQAAIDAATPAIPEYQEVERHLADAEASMVYIDGLFKAAIQRRPTIDTLSNINMRVSE